MKIVKIIFLYAIIGCKTVDCNAQSGEMYTERYSDGSIKSTIALVNGKGEGRGRIIIQTGSGKLETIDGKPVASHETYTIRFRLD